MPRWTIGIDDGFSMSRPTGIGRHTAAIMQALEEYAPDIAVRRIRHGGLERVRPRALRRAMYLAWLASGVPSRRLRRAFDLVHFTNFHVPPRRASVLPYAATIHDLVPFRVPDTKSRAYTRYLRSSIRHAVHAADRVFAVSFAVRDEIAQEFGMSRDAISVVYVPASLAWMPVTDARAHLQRAHPELSDAPFALFVGSLERRKNLVALVEALSRLPDALRDLRLVLAGQPGIGFGAIAEAVAAANARHIRVNVLTGCSDESLRALYSACHAFVYPSLYEGYGIPLLEAMQCRAPIVASDIPTNLELTAGAATIVHPTVDGIAAGLTALLESEELRARQVARGCARVACFTAEQTARQLLAGYGTVLGAHG